MWGITQHSGGGVPFDCSCLGPFLGRLWKGVGKGCGKCETADVYPQRFSASNEFFQ